MSPCSGPRADPTFPGQGSRAVVNRLGKFVSTPRSGAQPRRTSHASPHVARPPWRRWGQQLAEHVAVDQPGLRGQPRAVPSTLQRTPANSAVHGQLEAARGAGVDDDETLDLRVWDALAPGADRIIEAEPTTPERSAVPPSRSRSRRRDVRTPGRDQRAALTAGPRQAVDQLGPRYPQQRLPQPGAVPLLDACVPTASFGRGRLGEERFAGAAEQVVPQRGDLRDHAVERTGGRPQPRHQPDRGQVRRATRRARSALAPRPRSAYPPGPEAAGSPSPRRPWRAGGEAARCCRQSGGRASSASSRPIVNHHSPWVAAATTSGSASASQLIESTSSGFRHRRNAGMTTSGESATVWSHQDSPACSNGTSSYPDHCQRRPKIDPLSTAEN